MRLHLRQGLSIIGAQGTNFAKTIEKIELIQLLLSNERPANTVELWRPTYTDEGYPMISVHNRYFTRAVAAPNQPRVPFAHGVDPDGFLAQMEDHRFGHIDDNHVEYYGQQLGIG